MVKKVPVYLKKIIRSYLSQRTLLFEGQSSGFSNGVPQESALGPLLWNIVFDGILRLR